MKKLLYIFAILMFVFSCKVQKPIAKAASADKPKIEYTKIGAPMPDMVLVTYDTVRTISKRKGKDVSTSHIEQKIYTNDDFKNNANLLVMVFNPTCSHCMNETDDLKRHIDLFKKSRLVLIANKATKDYLPDFIKQRNTDAFKPIMTVGLDSNNYISQVYLYGAVPQINIYSPDRILLKTYQGDISIDSLAQYIQ